MWLYGYQVVIKLRQKGGITKLSLFFARVRWRSGERKPPRAQILEWDLDLFPSRKLALIGSHGSVIVRQLRAQKTMTTLSAKSC